MKRPRRDMVTAGVGALLLGIGLGMVVGGTDATTSAMVMIAIGVIIVLFALVTTSSQPAADTSEVAGWMEFRRELRRARRHVRPLTIVRIPRPIAHPAASAAADVRALGLKLRLTDRWWADEESVYVMLPESDRQAAVPVLDRLEAVRDGARASARVASFPQDGLTSGAIIAAIMSSASTAVPTPIRPTVDAPVFAEDEMAMGEARV
jgi:hypothetical protein